jgi:hypothetical protein
MKNLGQAAVQHEIRQRLQSVRPDNQRLWGKMTAHQMVCHLNDAFLNVMGDRPSARKDPRTLLKWGALWVPIPWPHGFPTMPELDQQIGGSRPIEFQNDVRELLNLFDRFVSQPPPTFAPHPVFGSMSYREWMRWGYLHTDHHLRQFGV